jgi:hypothetical protein
MKLKTASKPRSTGDGARELPVSVNVSYGSISLDKTGRLGVSIAGAAMTLEEAYAFVCNKRIKATLLARPGGSSAEQNGMFGDDGDIKIHGEFDVGSVSFDGGRHKFSLIFDLPAPSLNDYEHVAGRKGVLTIKATESLTKALPPQKDEE